LLQSADALDAVDEITWSMAEKEMLSIYFFILVTVMGASPKEIEERRKQLEKSTAPRRGQMVVKNEAEEWEGFTLNLRQSDSEIASNFLLTYALGGLGLPRHWYGFGDDTNRATAEAQNDPTWKTMQHDQDQIRDILVEMTQFAVDQAVIAGYYTPAEDDDWDIAMPEMTTRDTLQISQALSGIANALIVARDMGILSQQEAGEVFSRVVGELGVEIDTSQIEDEPEMPDMESEDWGAWALSYWDRMLPDGGVPENSYFRKHAPVGETE
jgi:hypothetical protein